VRATWRMLAGRRDLRLVLSAGIISLTGDWILTIGLVYRVYAMTGSTVASALTMASVFAPQVLLGAVAGVFADRWDRKRTMITADLLLAAGLIPLLLVRGPAQIWIVFAVMFWEGSVEQFFSPAQQAMVPRLVPDDELLTANAVSGQVSNVSRLAGSALGGVLAAAGGLPAVTLADAATFLASAALLALVRTSGRTASDGSGGPVRGRVFGAVSALEGVTVLAGTLGAGYLSRRAGIVPVLAIQGAGYVVAGLVMLVWLRDRAGPAAGGGEAQDPRDGGRVLAGADESLASLP
jgi:MFS family permease